MPVRTRLLLDWKCFVDSELSNRSQCGAKGISTLTFECAERLFAIKSFD